MVELHVGTEEMMKRVTFAGVSDCLSLRNDEIEVIATTTVGPRILCYRKLQGENIFAELGEGGLETPQDVWKPRGGHRLWAAPEEMPATYYPDNDPVGVEEIDERSVRLIGPIERGTELQKELRITLGAHGSLVTVDHLLCNRGSKSVQLAAWALSIMRPGGTTIIPQEPYRSHDEYLLPARPMVLWHFTNLQDSRWKLGKSLIQLSTNDALPEPQKIGVLNKQGWAAFYHEGEIFVKEMEYLAGADYPDYGCNTEAYTAGSFMELESLGPLTELAPGESVEHQERWHLIATDLPEEEEKRSRVLEALMQGVRH